MTPHSANPSSYAATSPSGANGKAPTGIIPKGGSHGQIGTSGPGCTASGRLYRLVDRQGEPHPVLDDLYDSLESAWAEALNWCQANTGLELASPACIGIGVEVSTPAGSWRTLRHPC